ncbi:hypothetical protein C7Q68_13690 [Staphylococcus aureus]|nr:hypothetical protein C7Q68_13690 [Staphylococcus aureus]
MRLRQQSAKNATRPALKAEVMMLNNKLNSHHTPPLCVKVTPEMLGDHYIISLINNVCNVFCNITINEFNYIRIKYFEK